MKEIFCFAVFIVSLLVFPSCSAGSGCTSPANNGQIYVIVDSNGKQQPNPQTGANGSVPIPCGGQAIPVSNHS